MPDRIRALRGAITLEADTKEQVLERTSQLLREMLARNGITASDVISILLTATEDITSEFPAAAGRSIGLGEIPVIGAREIAVEGGMPRCIRVLMHFYTDRRPSDLRHVFLQDAAALPTDLPR